MFNQSKDGIFQITRGDSGFIYCINNKEEEIPTVKLYDTSDATATASDIVTGKTAYTADGKVEGNRLIPTSMSTLVDKSITQIVPSDLDGITEIGPYSVYRCFDLISVELPNSIRYIQNNAFQNCQNMTTINLNEGLLQIGSYSIQNCHALQQITIPSTVTQIDSYAFLYDNAVTSIIVNPKTPPVIASYQVFPTNNCPIYVPDESVNTYKTTTNWSSLSSRIHSLSEMEEA